MIFGKYSQIIDQDRLVRLKGCEILKGILDSNQSLDSLERNFVKQISELNLQQIEENSTLENLYYPEDEDFLFLADINRDNIDCDQ